MDKTKSSLPLSLLTTSTFFFYLSLLCAAPPPLLLLLFCVHAPSACVRVAPDLGFMPVSVVWV